MKSAREKFFAKLAKLRKGDTPLMREIRKAFAK